MARAQDKSDSRPRTRDGNRSREASLRKRAASRGYTLVREGDVWYATIGETRFGPLRTFADIEEFLP